MTELIRYIKKHTRAFNHFMKPAAVILMYHRISNTYVEPNWLAVSPKNFDQHLRFIRRSCQPIRLLDLADAIENRTIPPRAVAVTFDDGYLDNLTEALPRLESFQVPATLFVTAGYLGSPREFWWDELPRLIMLSPAVPSSLSIRIQSQDYVWRTNSAEERQDTYLALLSILKPLSMKVKEEIISRLCWWAGTERLLRDEYRTMTVEELKRFAGSKFTDLGAHTMTHPILPTLSPDMQRSEIVDSAHHLETVLNTPSRTFAYPNGDFSDETIRIVSGTGFRAACTTITGNVKFGDDLFRLRRCAVNDWDIETFKNNLEAFYNSG